MRLRARIHSVQADLPGAAGRQTQAHPSGISRPHDEAERLGDSRTTCRQGDTVCGLWAGELSVCDHSADDQKGRHSPRRGRLETACGARTLAPRGEARPCGRAPALRGGIACFDRCLPCASAPGMTGALTTANCSPYPLQNHMNAHWVRRETHVLCSLCRKCVDPEMQKELGRAGCLVGF